MEVTLSFVERGHCRQLRFSVPPGGTVSTWDAVVMRAMAPANDSSGAVRLTGSANH